MTGVRRARCATELRIGHRDPRLDQSEARHAVLIQHGDLAIQDGLLRQRSGGRSRSAPGIAARTSSRCATSCRTFLSSIKQMARTPSHLISNSQSSPLGGVSDERATSSARWRQAWERALLREAGPDRSRLQSSFFLAGTSTVFARRQILRDFFLRAAGEHADGVLFGIPARARLRIFLLEQQPLVALAALSCGRWQTRP